MTLVLRVASRHLARIAAIVAALALLPAGARAQEPAAAAADSEAPNVWVSLALGRAYDRHDLKLGGAASFWLSSGALALGARIAGPSDFDNGSITDGSLLVGLRRPLDWATVVGAVGFGVSTAKFGCCDDRPLVGAMTYHGEAVVSARYAGVGVSVFGALEPASRAYTAIGLTLEIGRIH